MSYYTTLIVVFVSILLYSCKNDASKRIEPLKNTWEIAVPHQEIPEGLGSLSSKQCGICHQNHYKEWKMSTHAHAWTDMQFQAELKKESSPFMCINCHIPLQNQQEYIIKGLIDGDIYKPVKEINPNFDKGLQQEGINCASCHVRDNVIVGPTGTDKAPHKTVKNNSFLSEQLCLSCHNATATVTATLTCSFETGDEWKSGPYFGKKNCISCHMPEVNRSIAPGYENRKSRYHHFAGSGIPKVDSVETNILNGLSIFPSKIEEKYTVGDSLQFVLKLKNEYAGHKIPTGDPERFFNIKMIIKSPNGNIMKEQLDRIGEEWEWHPIAKKISENNLLPNEERTYTFIYPISKMENLSLEIEVTKHRMNKEAAIYNKLNEHYPLYISIYKKQYFIEVE